MQVKEAACPVLGMVSVLGTGEPRENSSIFWNPALTLVPGSEPEHILFYKRSRVGSER